MRLIRKFHIVFIFSILFGCSEDDSTPLLNVDERKQNAINDLNDLLTEPANGWVLEYQPNPGSGLYILLLDFQDDGDVRIQSDVTGPDRDFYDQTIPYRIDAVLELELILETYGVFHYLFEQNFNTFGAEYEFIYKEEDDGNLIFESKTDQGSPTTLLFRPASGDLSNLLSPDVADILNEFDQPFPQIFGGEPPRQQVIFEEEDFSVFWSIDLLSRLMTITAIGEGKSLEEVVVNNNIQIVNHESAYTIIDGTVLLLNPFSTTFNGTPIVIEEIAINGVTLSGDPFCPTGTDNTAVATGSISGLGNVDVNATLFDGQGTLFQPMSDTPYSVNALFVFNDLGQSLLQSGSIGANFPNASGFFFNYNFDDPELPSYAIGLSFEDANGDFQSYFRSFSPTTTQGNRVDVTLLNNFYTPGTVNPTYEQALTEITDEIFDGGSIFASILPNEGATVFRLYNPCNNYEFFLVQ